MKPRKVMIHVEATTNIPIKTLKDKNIIQLNYGNFLDEDILKVDQITVQVVKEKK